MKTLLSLFDYSGAWSEAFRPWGWDIKRVDLKHGDDVLSFDTAEKCLDAWGDVDGILIAVPCTDFTIAGAQYWPAKDRDGRTAASMALVNASFRIVDLYRPTDPDFYREGGTFFWALENPAVGRLPNLVAEWPTIDFDAIGGRSGWTVAPFRPRLVFDPFEYAGYLAPDAATLARLDVIRAKKGEGVTAEESAFVWASNAYTKKTGIWGDFTVPTVSVVEPVRVCSQGSPLMRLGGKSERTKELRSNTPKGFAEAFAQWNH